MHLTVGAALRPGATTDQVGFVLRLERPACSVVVGRGPGGGLAIGRRQEPPALQVGRRGYLQVAMALGGRAAR